MAFKLPELPYAKNALEPHIDATTMEIHHGKHHNAYTTNLNNVIANLFNLLKFINSFHNNVLNISSIKEETFSLLKKTYTVFVEEILGLKEEKYFNENIIDDLLEILLNMYKKAKDEKDYGTVDLIRSKARNHGIIFKDSKLGVEWSYEE